jgi:hypothetical protein
MPPTQKHLDPGKKPVSSSFRQKRASDRRHNNVAKSTAMLDIGDRAMSDTIGQTAEKAMGNRILADTGSIGPLMPA